MYRLVWTDGTVDSAAGYGTLAEALAQAEHDASQPGGLTVRHIEGPARLIWAAYKRLPDGTQVQLEGQELADYAQEYVDGG